MFSIASSPRERDRLTITYAVKGAFTTRMERELAVGREVWVKLPYGEFVIDPTRDAVLFAGGTGVTAFTAFLQSLTPDARPASCCSTVRGRRISSSTGRWSQARDREVPSLTCRPHLRGDRRAGCEVEAAMAGDRAAWMTRSST